MTRLQFHHWKTLLRSRIYPWVGQVVKSHTSPGTGRRSVQDGKVRASCCPWSVVNFWFHFILQAKWRSGTRKRTPFTDKTQHRNKKRDTTRASDDRLRDLPEWLEEFTEKSRRCRSACTRKHFSGLRFGTSYNRSTEEAQCLHTSKKIEIAKCGCEPRWQGLLVEAALAKQCFEQESLVTWTTTDHKVLIEESESSKQSLWRSRGTRSSHSMGSIFFQCKTKTSQETEKSSRKFLEQSERPKVIYTDNSLEFGKSCEDLSWNCRTSTTPHRSENGVAESKQVWTVNGGLILWNAIAVCEMCKTSWHIGKHLLKGDLGNHTKAWLFRLVQWLNVILFFERPVKIPSVWQESLTWIAPRIRIARGGKLEGWRSGCRPWGVGDGRIGNLLKKTQCERGDISPKRRIYFSNSRWTNQNSRRRSGTENIHLDTAATKSRRESRWFSWRIRRISSTTSWLVSGCRWSDKRCLVHVGKLHTPPSRWTQSHWNTLTSHLDVKQGRRIDDHWNIDGSRDLSDPWTGFTHLLYSMKNLLTDIYGPGERLTGKQLTSRPDHLWSELWKSMGKHAKLKEKQTWSDEKFHLENARKLRGIYFIDPEDTEFKETIFQERA